jgi:hypothetical protein
MTQTKPSSISRYLASTLLAAWNSCDLATLGNALDQAANADKTDLPCWERERIEVLQGIAETIDRWQRETRRAGQVDLDVSVNLLSHLAQQRDARDSWRPLPVFPREVGRSEKPAFFQSRQCAPRG